MQQVWEKRYRDRVAAASEIFERTCHVRFKVVAVGTWTSDDNATDLVHLIDEFEQKVKPAPAQLAIGFTRAVLHAAERHAHRRDARPVPLAHSDPRMGPARSPSPSGWKSWYTSWGTTSGAVHSPEHQSVMRPDISDRQSRLRSFHISFDARNAKAMSLVAEELAKRPLVHLGQLPPATQGATAGRCTSRLPPHCPTIRRRRGTWPCWTSRSAWPASRRSVSTT